ncbi:hypothetical protein D0863_01529 [Hortaea werneckii]|uniref:C2H2-type domain-containing protein n=1 Tax=Hortaea werneckii TaxID=91943 RepID=A0A3M7ELQ0_HORWE|nr:hypothetical protein D0863_01529 [Hortaea werneckii]
MSESYLNSGYEPCGSGPIWDFDFQLFPDDVARDTNAFDPLPSTANNRRPSILWPSSSGTLESGSFSSLNPSDSSPATELSSQMSSTSSPYVYSPFVRSHSLPDILASVGHGTSNTNTSPGQCQVDVEDPKSYSSHQLLAPVTPNPKKRLSRLPTSAPASVSRRQGSARHPCDVISCSKSFSRPSDLVRHMKTIHHTASEHYHCKAMGCYRQDRRLDKIREHCSKKHGQSDDYYTQDDKVAEMAGCLFATCRDFGTQPRPDRSPRKGARRSTRSER